MAGMLMYMLKPGIPKVALRAGGGLVVGATAVLCAAKASAPAENGNRAMWLQRHTYRADVDSSNSMTCSEHAATAALATAQVPLAEFLEVARTRWNGVELCLEKALQGGASAVDAVSRLRAAGMLQMPPEVVVKPETVSTYGANIGTAAPTYLGRPSSAPRLSSDSLLGALDTLREDGVAIVANVVAASDVQSLRRQFHMVCHSKFGPTGCPADVITADIANVAGGAAKPVSPSYGRRHFLIRGTDLGEKQVTPLLAPLMPLIYRYFAEHRPDLPPGSVLDCPPAASSGTTAPSSDLAPSFFLSECQILVSDPGAVAQIWHKDNRQPGLTVIIPLTDVSDEVGPTHVLPGTHRLLGGGLAGIKHAASSLYRSSGAIAAAPLEAGSAFIYDGRLMHRGLENNSHNRCRVVIVMRIDCTDAPPPGATVWQTSMARSLGSVLQYIGVLYTALPLSSSSS